MNDAPSVLNLRNALKTIVDPISGRDIVASGAASGLRVDDGGTAHFVLEASSSREEALAPPVPANPPPAPAPGLTPGPAPAPSPAPPPRGPLPASSATSPSPGGHDNPLGVARAGAADNEAPVLASVKNVIAVASGKGGVGKSTVAANLAIALARRGLKTGLLDADIYGPSLPTLLGLSEKPPMRDGKIVPREVHGVAAMSIGLLVDPEQALAWRGPMVMGAVRQLLNDVAWGELDVMVIDTPPGTGDAHLSLARTRRLTGAVIVSTPQEMALADVRRGIALFNKTNVPVIGVVENMAWLEGPDGARQYLFGEGGARRAAEDLGVPFLGEIPIVQQLREASDAGVPLAATASEGGVGALFDDLARRVSAVFAP